MRRAQRAQLFSAYDAQRSRGVLWACSPQENFFNLDYMKVFLRPSETTITTQNLWQLDCNSGDSLHGRFSEPLPFGIILCIWSTAGTELSLDSCRFECFMSAEYEAVIHVEVCAKRAVNLRV